MAGLRERHTQASFNNPPRRSTVGLVLDAFSSGPLGLELILKRFIFLFLFVWIGACLLCECKCLQRPEEGARALWSRGYRQLRAAQCRGWELNSDPAEQIDSQVHTAVNKEALSPGSAGGTYLTRFSGLLPLVLIPKANSSILQTFPG